LWESRKNLLSFELTFKIGHLVFILSNLNLKKVINN